MGLLPIELAAEVGDDRVQLGDGAAELGDIAFAFDFAGRHGSETREAGCVLRESG